MRSLKILEKVKIVQFDLKGQNIVFDTKKFLELTKGLKDEMKHFIKLEDSGNYKLYIKNIEEEDNE